MPATNADDAGELIIPDRMLRLEASDQVNCTRIVSAQRLSTIRQRSRILIHNYCIAPRIPFPFVHDNTPTSILPETG